MRLAQFHPLELDRFRSVPVSTRWPRVPCFAAALLVSLGLWVGLIAAVLKLLSLHL